MLVAIGVNFESYPMAYKRDKSYQGISITFYYVIKYRTKLHTIPGHPAILAYLQRRIAKGELELNNVNSPKHERNRYDDYVDVWAVYEPANLKRCDECREILYTLVEKKYNLCDICTHYKMELFLAKNLVGENLLSDDEEEYYKGLLE
jgi:hypothetical protein